MASDSPSTGHPAAGRLGTAGSLLRRYFYSGWAFLIPYLFSYLLYYLLKWPVNPGSGRHIPPLLHIYWALHLVHAILGLLSLCAWWQGSTPSSPDIPSPAFHPAAAGRRPLATRLLPWLLLALVFYIPGAYLEFPSDPWEHYRRINVLASAADSDFSLYKISGYFFAHSLLALTPDGEQLHWLAVYYTGACLLLCWQYFRLGRAAGLGPRSAFLFVLLQSLLFGNSTFSFYRYYGIASTIFSQLGAIGLIRLGLEAANPKPRTGDAPPPPSIFRRLISILRPLPSALCLVLMIALNHVQGLGIAALGLAAVAVWRLLEWRRSMIWWLSIAALVLSIAVMHWWPHHRSLDRIYRAQGWFTAWDGFNILSPRSPAGDRALQILGLFGVINLAAGLLLLRRNHVIGWLTVIPVLALCLPFAAIPLAGVLTKNEGPAGIITFHRMLFAIPAGLALVHLGRAIIRRQAEAPPAARPLFPVFHLPPFAMPVLVLLALVIMPASGPFYNRTWHTLMKPPPDLSMRPIWTDFHDYTQSGFYNKNSIFTATSGISVVLNAQKSVQVACAGSTYYYAANRSPSADLELIRNEWAEGKPAAQLVMVVPQPSLICTPYSFAALCSLHWSPQEAALAFSGARELHAIGSTLGLQPVNPDGKVTYYNSKK